MLLILKLQRIKILVGAAILTPTYFNGAIALWTEQYSRTVMEKMQVFPDSLTDPAVEPVPSPQPPKTDQKRHRQPGEPGQPRRAPDAGSHR